MSVYIDTDSYLDEVSYVAGDTLIVRYGATLTIRKSPTVNPGDMTTAEGTIHIDSYATGAVLPIVVTLYDLGSDIIPTYLGTLKCTGKWHSLGTGDGTANQAFAHIHDHSPAFIEVETSAGSGEYIPFLSTSTNSMTYVGAGTHLGRFFVHDEATGISTFGDGTNGAVVPNGANVRVPDIFITSAAAYNTAYASRSQVCPSYMGGIHCDLCSFSDRIYFYINKVSVAYIHNVGVFGQARIVSAATLDLDGFHVTCSRQIVTTTLFFSGNSGDISNLSAVGYSTTAFSLTNNDIIIRNFFGAVLNQGSGDCSIYASGTNQKVQLESPICLAKIRGGFARLYINNLKYSDTLNGVLETARSDYAFQLYSFADVRIDGVEYAINGTCPRGTLCNIGAGENFKLLNVNVDSSNASYFFSAGSTTNIIIARCALTSARSRLLNFAPTAKNVLLANITGTSLSPGDRINATNVKTFGVVRGSTIDYTYSGSTDIGASLLYDAGNVPTTGRIRALCIPELEREYVTYSGGAVSNNVDHTLLRTLGDSVTYTYPDIFYGVTSFINIAPTVSRSTNISCEYQINIGEAGWSVWKSLTAANLVAENLVSAGTGFRLAIRTTCVASSSSNYLRLVDIMVNVDSTYVYPIEYVEMRVRCLTRAGGVIPGCRVQLMRASDDSIMLSGITNSSGELVGEIEFDGETPIYGWVRKSTSTPFYKQGDLSGEITSLGFNTSIVLVSDE